MANQRDLEIKIQALIEGAKEVQDLRNQLGDLSKTKVTDNSKGFRDGLNASELAAGGLDRSTKMLTRTLGALGLAFSAVGIARFATRQIELADQLQTTANTIGINVETLQAYRFAAEEASLSTSVLDNSMQRFIRRSASAANGTGAARSALQELNIQLRDSSGAIRPVEDLFDDVADAMAKVPTQADRLRLAFDLFGREGQGMVQMLMGGSKGLRENADEAQRLGLILSTDTVKGAADANREIDKMKQVITSQFAQVVLENADSLTKLADALAKVVSAGVGAAATVVDITEFVAESVAAAIHGPAGDDIVRLGDHLDSLIERRARIEEDLTGPRGEHIARLGGTERLKAELKKLDQEIANTKFLIDNYWEQQEAKFKKASKKEPAGTANEDQITLTPEQVKAEEQRQKQIQAIIDRLKEQAATYGMSADAVAVYQLEQLSASKAQIDAAQSAAQTTAALRDHDEAVKASSDAYDELTKEIEQNEQADADLLNRLEREIELLGMGNRERAIATATAKLSADATDEQRQAVEKLAGSLFDLAQKSKESGESMSEFAKQGARNIQSHFAEFLFDPFDKGLQGMLLGFSEAIRRMIAEALAAQALQAFFAAMSGGASAGSGNIFATLGASVQHSGGMAGSGPTRQVPAAMFVGARRYHSGGFAGLAPDEVPAILQRGELVLSRSQVEQVSRGDSSSGRLQVELSDGLVGRLIRSDEGLDALVEVVRRNKGTFRGVLN